MRRAIVLPVGHQLIATNETAVEDVTIKIASLNTSGSVNQVNLNNGLIVAFTVLTGIDQVPNGTVCTVSMNNRTYVGTVSNGTGGVVIPPQDIINEPDGNLTIVAQVVGVSDSVIVPKDTVAPTAPIVNSITSTDPRVHLTGRTNTLAGDTFSMEINGTMVVGNIQINADGTWLYIPDTDLILGDNTIVATNTDSAGNTSSGSGIATIESGAVTPKVENITANTASLWTQYAGSNTVTDITDGVSFTGSLDDGRTLLLDETQRQMCVTIKSSNFRLYHLIEPTDGTPAQYVMYYTDDEGGYNAGVIKRKLDVDTSVGATIVVDIKADFEAGTGKTFSKTVGISMRGVGPTELTGLKFVEGFPVTPVVAPPVFVPPVAGAVSCKGSGQPMDITGVATPTNNPYSAQAYGNGGPVRYSKQLIESPGNYDGAGASLLNMSGRLFNSDTGAQVGILSGTGMRPSWTSPTQFYKFNAGIPQQFEVFDLADGSTTVLFDFRSIGVSRTLHVGDGEGNSSIDNRLWVMTDGNGAGHVQNAYVYDNDTKTVLGQRSVSQMLADAVAIGGSGIADDGVPNRINTVSMSKLGSCVIAHVESTSGGGSWGYLVYDIDMTNPRTIGYNDGNTIHRVSPGHEDFILDADGNDCFAVLHWNAVLWVDLTDLTKVYRSRGEYGHVSGFASVAEPGRLLHNNDSGQIVDYLLSKANHTGGVSDLGDTPWSSLCIVEDNPTPTRYWGNAGTAGATASINLCGTRVYYNTQNSAGPARFIEPS